MLRSYQVLFLTLLSVLTLFKCDTGLLNITFINNFTANLIIGNVSRTFNEITNFNADGMNLSSGVIDIEVYENQEINLKLHCSSGTKFCFTGNFIL